MKFRILPYKISSTSAKMIAKGLEALRIYPDRRTYRYNPNHILINWGCSNTPYEPLFDQGPSFNHPRSVAFATDKRVAYQLLAANGISVPEYTDNPVIAESWRNDAFKVYGRDTATGCGGKGITVYNGSLDEVMRTHLFYTRGVDNKREYRIHVANGRVLDLTQKRKRNGHANINNDIKSYGNGWVFCRNDIVPPPELLVSQACDSVRVLGLHFGAVDCCVGHNEQCTVFEVNTAPGIEGTTLQRYINFFKGCVNV